MYILIQFYTYIDITTWLCTTFFLRWCCIRFSYSSIRFWTFQIAPFEAFFEASGPWVCAKLPFFSLQAKTKVAHLQKYSGWIDERLFDQNPGKRSRNTKSEASNAIPCLCAFILPIAQLKDNFFDAFFLLFPLCGAGSFKKSIFIEERRTTGDSVDVLRNSLIFQFPRKFGTFCSQASQYITKRSTLGSKYIGVS